MDTEHKILPKEWFLWLWAAAVGVALFLLAPKLTGRDAGILVLVGSVIFAILVIFPLQHLPWIVDTAEPRKRKIKLACCVSVSLLLTVGLAMLSWPEPEFRSLSDGQQATLRNMLAEHLGAVEIAVPMQDVEANRYAEQFDAVFRRANWKVYGVDSLWESRPAVGIVVRYKKNAEQSANVIISALVEIGLKPDKTLVPTDPSTANNFELMLLLGKKP
jgi:hypothetical protein